MGKGYISYNPNQVKLLAPNPKDWLSEGHLAFFIEELVRGLDLSPMFEYYERTNRGRPPYHPEMMTRVILYGYSVGVRSSRKIEEAMHNVVAFRYLGAENFPDFHAINEFRRIHLKTLDGFFKQVLDMCMKMKLVKLGTVAIDGTKIKANASLAKSRNHDWYSKEEERIKKELRESVRKYFEDAERIDREEDELYGPDNNGYSLPKEFRTREGRLKKIEEAKRMIEEEQKKKKEEYDEKLKEREDEEKKRGKKLRGRKPKPVDEKPEEKAKVNTTDPESKIMKTRSGYVQGYNGQIGVDADTQIILAKELTQDHNDKQQMAPMLEQVEQNLGCLPKNAVLDAGYWSEDPIKRLKDRINLFVATTKNWKQKKRLRELPPPRGRIPKDMNEQDRMDRKLRTKAGRRIYSKRGSSVEPVNGQIKSVRGCDHLLLRGKEKGGGEFSIICTTHNILKMWRSEKPLPG